MNALSTARLCGSLFALSLSLVGAPAAAQPVITYSAHPALPVDAAVNNVSGPTTYGYDARIFVMRRTTRGVAERVFDVASRTWNPWVEHAQPAVVAHAAVADSLVATGGEHFDTSLGLYLPRFNAFYDGLTTQVPCAGPACLRLAVHGWNWIQLAHSTAYFQITSSSFHPMTAYTWRDNLVQRIHTFASDVTGSSSLREFFFNGSGFGFAEHPLPSGDRGALVGPGGALWTNPRGSGHGYVFVTTRYDSFPFSRVWARHRTSATGPWAWDNLGAPSNVRLVHAPVSVQYPFNGRMRVAIFVVGQTVDGTQGVYCRYTDDNSSWSSWVSFGAPNRPSDEPYRGALRFDLTEAVTFPVGNTQRIAVVGTSERVTRLPDGTTGHQLGGEAVVLLWNGSQWAWQTPIRVERSPNYATGGMRTLPFQTTSVTAVRTQDFTRVSIFGHDQGSTVVREISSPDGVTWTPAIL